MMVHLGVLSSISSKINIAAIFKMAAISIFLDKTYNINARISKVYTVDA
jgi:hypothetical protein